MRRRYRPLTSERTRNRSTFAGGSSNADRPFIVRQCFNSLLVAQGSDGAAKIKRTFVPRRGTGYTPTQQMIGAGSQLVPSPGTSLIVFAALGLILAASATMFWVLAERFTSRRQRVSLSEWARDEGFRLQINPDERPEPFDLLTGTGLGVRVALTERKGVVSLVQIGTWHVLIHRIEPAWKPSGLRPATATSSVLDLFSLASFPLMGSSERFVLFSTDPDAARSLSASSARALLPPDIGLLLHGNWLVLDFSSRPFDVVELNRMRAVAAQVTRHLASR